MRRILGLLSSVDGCLTGFDLARSLEVTPRTIREDIKNMNYILRDNNIRINAKKGKGYYITYESYKDFRILIKQIEDIGSLSDLNPVTPEDRERYIVKRLLYSDASIKIETLMDELYVSETTVKNDLQKVKALLKKYNIRVSKTNSGIHAVGHEMNKRFCISDYLIYRTKLDDEVILDLINSSDYQVTKSDLDKITGIILEKLYEANMEISDEALKKIAVHMTIAINRNKNGQFVDVDTTNLAKLKKESEYKVSQSIINDINELYQLSFSENEVSYTTMHLVGNRVLYKGIGPTEDLSHILGEEIYRLSQTIIDEVDSWMSGINLKQDEELIYSLGIHLKQLMNRLNFNMNFRNPLLNKIKIKYPLAFEAGVISAQAILKETGYHINESEIGFLALHFGVAIEKHIYNPENDKKKVALVCASGMATSELLLAKLSNLLADNFNMMGAYALHQINELLDQRPDIILTTVPIEHDIGVPVLRIPSILDNKDISKVKQFMDKPETENHIFSQFMKQELFFSKMDFETKQEAIQSLTDYMVKEGFINNEIKNSIMKRENIAPTAIGGLVAIPHPMEVNVHCSCICTAILEKEISWAQNEKASLIFIIVLEEKWRSKFQEIFTALYDIVHSSENVSSLIKQESYDDFIQTIELM